MASHSQAKTEPTLSELLNLAMVRKPDWTSYQDYGGREVHSELPYCYPVSAITNAGVRD